MSRNDLQPMIRDVIAGLIGQAVLAAFLVAVFYGYAQSKLQAYDLSIAQNAIEHREIISSIDDINRNGTVRGQPVYTDLEMLKRQMDESRVDRARMNTKLDMMMDILKRLEEAQNKKP